MQTSWRVCALSGVVLAFGCTGFEPHNYDAPAPPHAKGGGAGYSYQFSGGAGSAAVLPPASDQDGAWGPSGAGTATSLGEGGTGAGEEHGPVSPRDGSTGGTKSEAARPHGEGGNDGDDGGGGESGVSSDGHTDGAGHGGVATGGRGGSAASAAGRAGSAGKAGSAGRAGSAGGGGGGSGGSGGDETGMSAGGTAGHAGTPPSVLFSEYVEGSSRYKALELRALTPAVLDGCRIATYSNGGTSPKSLTLSGTLGAGATLVVCTPDLAALLGPVCTLSASLSFNGNDALALECGEATLDVIGQVGVDPGEAWTSGDVATANQTLRRRCAVTRGDTERDDAFDPALEWVALPTDDFSGLGSPDCG